MDKNDVREIENIVDQKLVVASDIKFPMNAGPAWFHVLAEVGDQRGIGKRDLTEPDKDEPMDFVRRKTSCPEIAADLGVARNTGAGAVGGEADAVIAALNIVAHHFAG